MLMSASKSSVGINRKHRKQGLDHSKDEVDLQISI